ncbi:MAG: hypothetical protein ACRC92_20430 [Peptostreptococcaceae bacterium]
MKKILLERIAVLRDKYEAAVEKRDSGSTVYNRTDISSYESKLPHIINIENGKFDDVMRFIDQKGVRWSKIEALSELLNEYYKDPEFREILDESNLKFTSASDVMNKLVAGNKDRLFQVVQERIDEIGEERCSVERYELKTLLKELEKVNYWGSRPVSKATIRKNVWAAIERLAMIALHY